MKRKTRASMRLLAAGAAVLIGLTAPVFVFAASKQDIQSDRAEVYDLITRYHVSGIGADALAGDTIEQMLGKLNDPYSNYFSIDDYRKFQNSLEREYVGIGVEISERQNGLYIVQAFAGSPAEAGGLREGDLIVSVEGASIAGKSFEEVSKTLMGEENTKVKVGYSRDGHTETVMLTRSKISLPVVTGQLFDRKTGYIRIASFSEEADERFSVELANLQKAGMASLIVDLRDNPGGFLESAKNIAGHFLSSGILMHTKDRNGADQPVLVEGGSRLAIPVFFLVNEGSASASEVLTGFVQDYHLAKVIGTKTFGKGSVQSLFSLASGSTLKLTVDEYMTPDKRKVNKVGLKPDEEVEGDLPQLIEALRESGIGALTLERTPAGLRLDDVKLDGNMAVLAKDGRTYVPSRVLAALIGGQAVWHGENRSVAISAGDKQIAFTPESGSLLLENGTGYLDIAAFGQAFPQLNWNGEGNRLTIHVTKAE